MHLVAHLYEKRESASHIKAKEGVDGGGGCECVAASGPLLPLDRQPFATVQHRKSGRLKFPAKDAIQTRNQKESDLWAS